MADEARLVSRIPDEIIEQVRDAADLVGLVSEGVDLKRTGSDFRGPCPFHGGTHRNFSVSPKHGSFYCFVCHEKGDVFSYLMKRFGLDYPSAVREAARRSGIIIPETQASSGPDPREPLFEAIAVAQDWYSRQLLEDPKASAARDYLAERQIPLTTAGELGLGYGPPGSAFISAMQSLEIPTDRLVEIGLVVKRDDGSLLSRFRSRLLFPIADVRGRVVGFGGRLLGPGEPKYLNSPETPIFRKGTLLYNLHVAKNAIRKENSAVLVEGYFDVIRLVLAGVENVVAPLGTSMTPDQASLLARYTKHVTLLYDSDQAGLRATFRSGDELLRQAIRVSVATIPLGEDPDSLVGKGGAAALQPFLRDAIDVMDRKLRLLAEHGWFNGLDHRRAALDKLLPTIRAATERFTRDLYVDAVAKHTGVSRETIVNEVEFEPTVGPTAHQSVVVAQRPRSDEPRSDPSKTLGMNEERSIVHIMLESETWLERAKGEVKLEWFRGIEFNEIARILLGEATESIPAALDGASARAKLALNTLRSRDAFVGLDYDTLYVACCVTLQARPLVELYRHHKASLHNPQMRDRRTEIAGEMRMLREELNTIYPMDWKRHVFRNSFSNAVYSKVNKTESGSAPPAIARRNVS